MTNQPPYGPPGPQPFAPPGPRPAPGQGYPVQAQGYPAQGYPAAPGPFPPPGAFGPPVWRGPLPNRLVSTWLNPLRIIQYISVGIVAPMAIVWFVAMCVIIGKSGQPNPGMVALVCIAAVFIALALAYMVVAVRSTVRQEIVIDESGITRTGTGGWHVDWRDMERVKLQRPMATSMITVIERPEVRRLRRNWLLNWSYLQPWKSVMSAIEDVHQPVIAAMVAARGIPVER